MLIGVGGSGKQSLAKLAVYMAELAPTTIVISKSYSLNDFKADLQVRIAPCGVVKTPTFGCRQALVCCVCCRETVCMLLLYFRAYCSLNSTGDE